MSNSLKFRGLLVVLCLILSVLAIAPTLTKGNLPQWWLDTFGPIQLGLDLQGGMHLVLGVDVDKAVESRVDTIIDQTETQLREKDIIFKRVERRQGDRLVVLVYDKEEGAKVDAFMADDYPSLEAETFTGQGGYIEKHFRLGDNEIENIKDYAVRQALETLRNRVDQFGVSEPTLQRQSGNRILIQLRVSRTLTGRSSCLVRPPVLNSRLSMRLPTCRMPSPVNYLPDGSYSMSAMSIVRPVPNLRHRWW